MKSTAATHHGLAPHRRVKVNLGSTFQTRNKQDTSFHTIRYPFLPESVERARTGHLRISKDATTGEPSACLLAYNSYTSGPQADGGSQNQVPMNGTTAAFQGPQNPSKPVECLLIYDEQTGSFTLERLQSSFGPMLRYKLAADEEQALFRSSQTAANQQKQQSNLNNSIETLDDSDMEDLEKELLDVMADA